VGGVQYTAGKRRFTSAQEEVAVLAEEAETRRIAAEKERLKKLPFYRRTRLVDYVLSNFAGLAAYQALLELLITGGIAFGVASGCWTVQGIEYWIGRYYPFPNIVDLAGGVHHEDLRFGILKLSKEDATALHVGHNVAFGLLPVQFAFVLGTYRFVQEAGWRIVQRFSLLRRVRSFLVTETSGNVVAERAQRETGPRGLRSR
jgi:hypothetical protein